MYLKSINKGLISKLQSLIPQLQEISCSKVTNFLTMNISAVDGTWAHSGNIINNEHAYALAYLQSNYKYHIVNRKSVGNIKNLVSRIQNTDYEEIKEYLWPESPKISDRLRKSFYIYDHGYNLQQLMECSLMRNKGFNKIICFSKQKPLKITSLFEKFCLEYNVRALGLNQFSICQLIAQINKVSKSSILIHEFFSHDYNILTQKQSREAPGQLIFFLKRVKEGHLKRDKFPQLKQILNNYMKRQTFQYQLKLNTSDFSISRLQHIEEFKKYSQSIEIKQSVFRGEDIE